MGSLHCAHICMDVSAALIGQRWDRPAPCLVPPALETPLRAAPPPGTEWRGHGGRGGAGVLGALRGRGGVCRRQAGGGDLESARAGPGFSPQVEVSPVAG